MGFNKNILWIDDMDNQDSLEADLETELNENDEYSSDNRDKEIKDHFGNFSEHVNLVETVDGSLEEIEKNIHNYDLVIFDIDMNKGIENFENIRIKLNRNHIAIPDYNNFKDQAGIYILLFLLTKGFPLERMALLTGNDTKTTIEILEKSNITNFDDLLFEKNNVKSKFIPWLNNKYDNGSYYRVRRLVYQACNYWERKINDKNYEVPFNRLYGLDNEKQSFGDMLEQIKIMFSVIKPDKPEEVYYQALHIVSMFHEEKASIKKADKTNLKPYHQMIRNFRNWSSHNKFINHNLSADQFAFLFCVALRTYFDTQKYEVKKEVEKNGSNENKKNNTPQYEYYLNKDIYYYENVYFTNLKDIDWSNVHSKIEKYWYEMIKEVRFYGGRVNREILLKDVNLDTLLQRLGDQNFKMPYCYINLSIFKSPFEKEKNLAPTQVKETLKISDNNVSIEFNYEVNKIEEIKSQFTSESKVNSFFEKIAISLLPSVE